MTLTSTDDTRHRRPPAALIRLLPVVAFLTTFGFFFVDKAREARSVLGSSRGLAVVAGIVAAYVVLAFATRRVLRRTWVPPVLLAGAVLGLAAWTVLPYYVDETSNRVLVDAVVADATDSTVPTTGPPPAAPVPAVEAPPAPPAAPVPAVDAPPAPPPAPVRVSRGDLAGIDHDAGGTVSLIRTPDGELVVRFEDFHIEGTPDPQLYLVAGEDVREPSGTHLGAMPGTRGDVFDVAVPAGSDAGPGWTVLVWCGRFSVPIANATQRAL